MNIINVSESRSWSGGTNQIFLTSRELARRGHNVTIVSPEGSPLAETAMKAGLKVRFLRIRRDYDLPAALKLAGYLREEKADILHAHHPKAHAIALMAKCFYPKARLVVTRRVIFPIPRRFFSRVKYCSSLISKFVAVCNETARQLEKGGVPAGRVSFIPSAIELPRWEEARAKRDSAAAGDAPIRVGLIGHYAHFKGHDLLINAAPEILKEFPGAKFIFAGRDTPGLEPLARSAGVEKSCEFLGERRDIPEILCSLSVFVMPSRQEGIATAIMEAQATGVPVVASNIGGIPDVVLNGVTGRLVPSDDPKALAAAVIETLRDKTGTDRMRAAALDRIRSMFTIPTAAERLEALYSKLIKGK